MRSLLVFSGVGDDDDDLITLTDECPE